MLLNCGLMPLITKAKRLTDHSSTIIDHIYSNVFRKVIKAGICLADVFGPSTYILYSRKWAACVKRSKLFSRFFSFDSDSFLRDVEAIEFSGLVNDDVNQSTGISNLVDILQKIPDKHAPKRRLNSKKERRLNKPWISNAIATSIKRKQRLFKSHFLSRDPEKIKIYKVFNNKLNRIISRYNLPLIVRP